MDVGAVPATLLSLRERFPWCFGVSLDRIDGSPL
jgi:hypothetical protein